jgi:putative phosphoribosyl transferase
MIRLPFRNREEAARALAERLADERGPCVVLALPRGGVPIGAVIARALHAPLDLLLVRKIGAPWQRELAVAALVDVGRPELVIDEGIAEATGASRSYIDEQARAEWQEIQRRREKYLRGRAAVPIEGATVIVVDDGIATGTTMRAALEALRRRLADRVVMAVPVAPHDRLLALSRRVDRVVCLAEPEPFHAVGLHYQDFHQVSDEEVVAALDAAAEPPAREA